jgi:hypothetical protein
VDWDEVVAVLVRRSGIEIEKKVLDFVVAFVVDGV